MKKIVLSLFLLTLSFSFAEESLLLEQVLSIAIKNNYEIKKQQYALAQAEGQFKQAFGELDVELGAQAQYTRKHIPVDESDPQFIYGYSFLTPDNINGIFSNDTLSEQTNGSVYAKKLFSFGLESKLSYTIQRTKNQPYYKYAKNYDYEKYEQENGRNVGELSIEISLPLFKSFMNSVAALQIDGARDSMEQMRFNLQDTIAKTMIQVSKAYWDYFLAWHKYSQLKKLQKKIEDRIKNVKVLQRAGVRTKNDLLAFQVNEIETQREVENALITFNQKKVDLQNAMGIPETSILGQPDIKIIDLNVEDDILPDPQAIDESFINYVINNRSDFIALQKKIDAAENQMKLARADSLPDARFNFSLGATGTSYSDEASRIIGAGFWNIRGINIGGSANVAIKLGNNTKKGALEAATASYNTALTEYKKAKSELYLNLKNISSMLAIYRESVKDADSVLEMQNSLYSNEQARFSAGMITVDNIIDADQKNINAQINYYQLLINYMDAVLQYKYSTASLLDIAIDLQ